MLRSHYNHQLIYVQSNLHVITCKERTELTTRLYPVASREQRFAILNVSLPISRGLKKAESAIR